MDHRLGYLSAAPRVSTRPEAALGGPRSHVLGVMHAFEALGWQVKTFIVGDRVPLSWIVKGSEETMSRNKIRVILADFMRLMMGWINARRAWNELGSDPDWVYERFASFQSLGQSFKKRGKLWILETNAPLFIESKNDRKTIALSSLARYLEEKAYQSCDVLVCISEELKQIIIESMQISSEKIIVMPNGVDATFFDPDQYTARRLFRGFTIGFVGSLIEWQGLDLLIEATRDLRAEGVNINLVFVGDGPARKTLEDKVNRYDLRPYSDFVGHVSREEVPAYISGFDIGFSGQVPLQMGRMYLSPLKLYEYMAMARPVIASDFEDARRVVNHGVTGFLFSAANRSELKKAILNAYNRRQELDQMGDEARKIVIAEHSWQARVSQLIKKIESLVDDSGL